MALLILLLAACGAAPDRTTEAGRYTVEWTSSPSPLPLNTLFEIHTTVRDAKTGAPVEDATVTVDATMPQHGHGMVTKPEADPGVCEPAPCRHPGGAYIMRGMKFHMPGEWTLHFEVKGPAGDDHRDEVVTL